MDELSEEDKLTVYRARKAQKFLSQPFTVGESFTGLRGRFVALQDTIDSFKNLLEGKLDHIPEPAFHMVGGQSDVELKAAALSRGEENDASATVELKSQSTNTNKKKKRKLNLEDNTSRRSIKEILESVKQVAERTKEKQLQSLDPVFLGVPDVAREDMPQELVDQLVGVVNQSWVKWNATIDKSGNEVDSKYTAALERQKTQQKPQVTASAAKH